MEIMTKAAEQALNTGAISLLGFEYPQTITLGRRAHATPEAWRTALSNTPLIPVSRGGLATLHNEGQCVIYPIVPIKKYGLFAKEWVHLLTQTTKEALEKCNIIVESTNAGVFTPIGKIASIGIDLKKGVSTHGIAINISNNLSDFSQIIPCGIAGQVFDRVHEYNSISTEDFFALWSRCFKERFAPYRGRHLTNTSVNLSL